MTVADLVIEGVDWPTYQLAGGPASDFGRVLAEFVASWPPSAMQSVWSSLENQVFAQDDIFTAAEPSISVLLAALIDERPQHVRIAVLDLLFHLVQGASYRADDLGKRCLQNAAAGAWLLVGEALTGPQPVTDACREILAIAAPKYAQFTQPNG
ncbi:hypothetical protein AB0L70_39735 [Kribbella sp. NPDC051952]|uniref:hypothetical protein n=1 Tax=Kribbella sp. NPDC051952 TaxID=3154851 RepID=UPI00344A65EF